MPVVLSIIGPEPYVIREGSVVPSKRKKISANGDIDEMTNLQHQNGIDKRINC